MTDQKTKENLDLFPETGENGKKTRLIALRFLDKILTQKQAIDQVFDRDEEYLALEARDKGFIRLLVLTILRRLGQIDMVINDKLDNPLSSQSKTVFDVLRMGVAQLLILKTPPHAAVNTSVEIIDDIASLRRFKGLVNAVLRRVSREDQALPDSLAVNIPSWLWNEWTEDYGADIAYRIVQASLTEALLDISVQKNADEWANTLGGTLLPTGSIRLSTGGRVQDLAGFDDGRWWVQDAAAALPAKLFGDLEEKKVIDLCAAPGGKTAQLASMGADVLAVDRSAKRIAVLKENMERLNLSCETVIADGSVWQPKEPVDAVLLDAPCSATGTIRRHPDLIHLKQPRDVERLTDIQQRLLKNAADMVKLGGELIYCTCSLQKSEGEDQARWFLKNHPNYQLSGITEDELGGMKAPITKEGYVRTLPYHLATQGGIDGFFIARFIRVG